MAKKAARRKARPATQAKVSAVRLASAALVSCLSFLLIIGLPPMVMFGSSVLVRGAVAGLAVGLLFSRNEWMYSVAAAAIGALVSALAIVIALKAMEFAPTLVAAAVVAAVVAGVATGLLSSAPEWLRMAIVGLTLTLVVSWSLGVTGTSMKADLDATKEQIAQVARPEQYAFDAIIFIKTVDYMRTGIPYYQSFQRAWSEDSRLDGQLGSAFNFREPLLFEIWKRLPGTPAGPSILNGYLFLAWAGTILSWLTARRFVSDGVAMLAGQAMAPIYAFMAFGGLWFTMAEIWASVAVIGALCLLVRRRYLASAIVIIVAVATRELAAVYVPAWGIAWWFAGERKRWLPGLAVALGGPLAVLGIHVAAAPAAQGGVPSLAAWMHSTGLSRTLAAIRFGGVVPFSDYLMPAAALGSVAGSALVREPWLRWMLLFVAIVPLVFLTAFSQSEWDYYWGLTFQPTIVVLAVLAFVRVFPSQAEAQV